MLVAFNKSINIYIYELGGKVDLRNERRDLSSGLDCFQVQMNAQLLNVLKCSIRNLDVAHLPDTSSSDTSPNVLISPQPAGSTSDGVDWRRAQV